MNYARLSVVGLAAVMLSGCLPLSVYYREGADVGRIERDETACEVQAQREVPKRILTRYIPPVYSTKPVCSGTVCTTQRILISPGRYEQYDANEGLRARAAAACMASKGYEKVSVKPCPGDVIEETVITSTKVQPRLTKDSCAIRIRGGKYQIVTPGSD